MSRRINIDGYQNVKAATSRLDMNVVSVLNDPRNEWKKLCYGGTKVARSLEIDWKKYNVNDYFFTHDTIVSSVAAEPNGYYINPLCSSIVNANGNAWTNEALLATFKSFIGGENYCFPAGTEVLMSDGTYKNIEDIGEGEFVISHRGKKQKVIHKFVRDYSGDFIETKINHYKRSITSTENHPFRAVFCSYDAFVSNRKKIAKHHDRIRRSMVIDALSGKKHFLRNFEAKEQWINAEFLQKGSVILGSDIPVSNGINVGEISELLGYYLAEGCLSKKNKDSGVVFVFGKHEEYLARKVEKLGKIVFPNAKITVTDKCVDFGVWRVQINSPEASKIFRRLGGSLSYSKKMSEEVFSWDKQSQMNVLTAWLEGDGDFHKQTQRIRGTTVSKSLGEQMLYLCKLNDIKASLVFTKTKIGEQTSTVHLPCDGKIKDYAVINRHHGWHLHISLGSTNKIIENSDRWERLSIKETKKQDFHNWKGKTAFIVSSVSRYKTSQKVYNLEVEEDNSYVINPGVAVHNCEHIQIPSLSKGKILDAVLRPYTYKDPKGNTADVFICDILVATDRVHWDLVQRIQSGQLKTLSMGCLAKYIQCSKCGQVFSDDEDSCDHLKHELLSTFVDENGVTRIVAELCGRSLWDDAKKCWVGDPESNKFIEASWVENPAYKGAVINHFIEANEIDPKVAKILASVNELDIMAEDFGKLRVADRYGMMAIRLAQQEYFKEKRQKTIENIIKGVRK